MTSWCFFLESSPGLFVEQPLVFLSWLLLQFSMRKIGNGKGPRQPDYHSDISDLDVFLYLAVLVGPIVGLVIGVIVVFAT